MEPTLLIGDNIWVYKMANRIERNDILVFNYPYTVNEDTLMEYPTDYYTKRCIGIPGDTFYIQNGLYKVSGKLRYKGSNGRLRVSARHLDEELSTDIIPAHSFDRVEKLQPGEIAEIEIDLFPIGIVFYPGEQLRLVISSKNDLGAIMPGTPAYVPENKGKHIIHTGGLRASYLQLPVKPV